MNGLSKFGRTFKRTSAVILAALITASCAQAAVVTADAAQIEEKPSSAGSILSNDDRGVIYANSRTDFRDESIYFLITTRFYDGDSSNNARTSEDTKAHNPESDPSWRGDFKGLIDKLDYIKALGFTAIWITPVVENDSGYDYHGYHAYDFSAVDTRYESNGVTYQTLIDACHAKGMKVIQDIVLNHTCNWGERNLLQITNEVYAGGRSNYVMPDGASLDPENIYHHNGFCGGGDWDNQEAQKKTIADDCFDLNTENPKVYNYLVDCYTKYINMGVDGFRVDTVKHINRLTFNSVFVPAFKAAGGEKFYMFGEVCTKGHDVWYRDNPPISTCFYTWADDSSWTSRWSNDTAANTALLDEHYAAHMDTGSQPTSTNAFLNGNDYHAPDNSIRSGMDSIDFQMHWSFNSANEAYQTALGEDRYFSDATWNVVYVDSHDYGPDNCQTLRYNGGTDAWAENLSLMFTFRGIPCIYYGSEIEFQAGKQIDVGPNAPLSETGRAYFGDHIEGNVDTSDFTVYGNTSGEVQNTLNATLSQHIMRLNRIRQAVPALRKGQYSTEGCSGNMAFKRRYTDSNTDSFACVAISGGATFSGVPNGTYVDAVTGDTQTVSNGTLTANCSGKGNLRVYVLNTAKTPAPGRVIPNGDYLTDGGAAEKIGPVDIPIIKVDPTGITLNKTALTITEGKTSALTATIAPDNATNKTVTWTSSNTSVATVSGGTVTAIAPGTATITAKTSNNLTATCSVTVQEDTTIVKPTGITLDKSTLTITKGNTAALTATVAPSNATNKTVTWTTSDSSVATVSGGTVTAVAAGTATITASTFNGKTAKCNVTVEAPSFQYVDHGFYFEKPSTWGSSINVYFFNKASNTTVGSAWPGTAMTDIGDGMYSLEYTNSDSNVVMIFNDGSNQSPARDVGGYEIKDQGLYNTSGYVRTIEKETTVDVTSVSLSSSTLSIKKGNTAALTATVSPSNATNKTITWSSSNTSVATVSGGTVTAVAAGTATITATSNNGKTATCAVTVTTDAAALTNTSTVSSSITLGNTINITGKATGGTAPYKYSYYYKQASQSTWSTKLENTTTTSTTIKPGTATTYNIKVKVTDAAGKTAEKTYNCVVNPSTTTLTNSSTVSSSITLGNTINITGKATGGTAPYKYSYYYKQASQSAWSTKLANTTTTSTTIKPGTATTYNIKVVVTDSAGKTATKTYNCTVKSDLVNSSYIDSSSIVLGDEIVIHGAATKGTGSYKYSYYFKQADSSSWTLKGSEYGTATKVTVKPSVVKYYDIKVAVKDNSGTVATRQFSVQVKTPSSLVNNSSLNAATINLGDTIVINGAASKGTGSYKYAYYFKQSSNSDWTLKGTEFGTATTMTVKPSLAKNYDILVKVKDSSGTVVSKQFTVIVNAAALTNNSTVSSSITLGSTINIKGVASGGTAPYKYSYYYKQASQSAWSTKLANTATTSTTVKPGTATTYNIKVVVTDSAGKTATKTYNCAVNSSTLTNTSTVSSSITLGSTISITGKATGGTAPYKYSYYYKQASQSAWSTKLANTTTTSTTVKPGTATTYNIKVVVTDSAGKTATKTYNVTVNPAASTALKNNSSVSKTSITLGETITLKGAASGGSAPYTYAYYFKQHSANTWTAKGTQYGTETSQTLKPSVKTTYDVKINISDSTGETVEKTFTITVQ